MPRKNPISPREAAICGRLLQARRSLRLSRVAFASEAGIDSSQLRRYEECAAPLRYEHAKSICRAFRIPLVWLAAGGDFLGEWEIDDASFSVTIPPRALLSVVHDDHLAHLHRMRSAAARTWAKQHIERSKEVIEAITAMREAGVPPPQGAEEMLRTLEKLLAELRDHQRQRARFKNLGGAAPSEKKAKKSAKSAK